MCAAQGPAGLHSRQHEVNGCRAYATSECSETLRWALDAGHVECIKVLLAAHARVSQPCEGSPPLHIATCAAGHLQLHAASVTAAGLLLQHGADPYNRCSFSCARSLILCHVLHDLPSVFGACGSAARQICNEPYIAKRLRLRMRVFTDTPVLADS